MQPPPLAGDFAFGRYRFNASERVLWADGEPVKLGGRAFDVLLALAERRGRAVAKNELLDIVWPNLVVEENNLQVQIHALRKLFGPELIATIPGRGYRFTAALEDGTAAATPLPVSTAAPAAARAPTNLPAEPLPLYGRDRDLDAVRRLLETQRLVTIVGAGGIGKTRLAQAAAHAARHCHADGVWLIELAPLADAALLPSSIAQALGLQLRGQRPVQDELIAALESKQQLLVLDNCEHLLDAVGSFAQALLARAPGVHLLGTSQEPLKLPGEQLWRLGTLAVPPAADSIDAVQAIGYGAVRLFVERVQALDPRFVLDDHNAAAVIDICRHLDGLALAIELAAARVPLLGVQGVVERLGERLRLLTAGSRIALRRHRTLRAALDWSHGLLAPQEQAVFRRLGVFSGGCSIEAAQRVAADEQIDDWSVLDIIARLVDKSLVVADADERPRLRLLESARAYALEKLAAAGETDALAQRHAGCFAAHFEHLADALYAAALTEDGFIAARAQELDNLRAALAWSLGAGGDLDTALALLAHCAPVALLMPSYVECERWALAVERRVGAAAPSPQRAALHGYVQIHWGVQRLRLSAQGRQAPDVSAAALRALDDPRRRAHALCALALHALWHGDVAAARSALAEVAHVGTTGWPGWLWAQHLETSIRVGQMAGETTSAVAAIGEVLERLERDGDGAGRAAFAMRTRLAEASLLQGRLDEAAQRFEALAEQGRRQRRDAYRMCFVLAPLALVLIECERLDAARDVVLEALPLLQRTGMRSDSTPVLALLAARRGRPDAAARLLGAGDAFLARAAGHRSLIEQRTRQRTLELLEAALPKQRLEARLAEGAALGEEDFARLVIDSV